MLITSENYRQALRQLRNDYSNLPWYQRWWFSLWSYSLSDSLSAIDLKNPTTEQVDELVKMSEESWFFNSIFGLLTQFKEAIGKLSLSEQPDEIKTEIGIRLPPKDLVALACTTPAHYAFFESLRLPSQFLHSVAHGEYETVAAMLKKDISLLLHKGQVTDASGRRFFHISGFQYALWALDKHMWINILKCLPQNEEGATIKEKLLQQYLEVVEKGVAYELNGQRIRESHFDFENTIIRALRIQLNDIYQEVKSSDEINKQWREDVGFAQKKLPMHVVYEYCSNGSFGPGTSFIDQPSLTNQFYNHLSGKEEKWFHQASELGSGFAIYKSLASTGLGHRHSAGFVATGNDLAAMQNLFKVRSADFRDLESLLTVGLESDIQHSAFQRYSV